MPARPASLGSHDNPAPIKAKIVFQICQEIICFGEKIRYGIILREMDRRNPQYIHNTLACRRRSAIQGFSWQYRSSVGAMAKLKHSPFDQGLEKIWGWVHSFYIPLLLLSFLSTSDFKNGFKLFNLILGHFLSPCSPSAKWKGPGNKIEPKLLRNRESLVTLLSSGYKSNTSDMKMTHGAVSLAALSFKYLT